MRLLSAAVCALGAHAVLFGTFRPHDGMHGYFGWYEPAIAVVALGALVLLRPPWLRTRLPIGETVRRISTGALFFLLAQESLERSLMSGQPVFAVLTPAQWLVLLAGIFATALVLALALRAGQAVAALVMRTRATRAGAFTGWSIVTVAPRPARPLAERFALRAPPLPAG
jgi:hypothetical protein